MLPQRPGMLHVRTPSLSSVGDLASLAPGGVAGAGSPAGGSNARGGSSAASGHARTPSDGASSRRRLPAALARTRRTLELALGVSLFLWLAVIFYSSHGRFDVSRRGGDGAPGLAALASAGGGDGRGACGDATGAPAAGRFLLPRAAFAPPAKAPGRAPRVFVLTALAADAPAAPAVAAYFAAHCGALGVPPSQLLVLAQTAAEDSPGLAPLAAALDAAGVFHDVWVGPLPPASVLARRWQALLLRAARKTDWFLQLDADEALRLPPGQSLPALVAAAARLGYDGLLARRVEMLPPAAKGTNATAGPAPAWPLGGVPPSALFSRRCGLAVPPRGQSSALPAACTPLAHAPLRSSALVAGAGAPALLRLRALQDVGVDDRPDAAAIAAGRVAEGTRPYPVPLILEHYGWHAGAAAALSARAAALAACGAGALPGSGAGGESAARAAGAAEAALALAAALRRADGALTPAACPALRCAGPPAPTAPEPPPGGSRRIAVVSSVWIHVDGVSKTLRTVVKQLLEHPFSSAPPGGDTALLLLTPDTGKGGLRAAPLAAEGAAIAAGSPGLAVVPIPSLPAPGRPDYRWAPPLPASAAAELALFKPDAVHVAAPDFLGHSAVAWARANKVCSLCTYHTAFPTYLQYYGVGFVAPIVSAFAARFYRRCDAVAVPTWAAADALAAAGVPRAKMTFFPRGVDTALYRPSARSAAWRAAHAPGAGENEVLILWVARIVREKGIDTFVRALRLLAKDDTVRTPWRVLIAGTGPDLASLRKALPEQDAALRVSYLGHAAGGGLATALASCDIFFFPSRTEVFPNNVAEAMASGLAVVAEDVGVTRALVLHNATGVLVPPALRALRGEASAHAAALAWLVDDPAARARLGTAAARAVKGLSWQRAVAALVRGYDACAAHRRANAADASAAPPPPDFVADGGSHPDALIYSIGVNLTNRYAYDAEVQRQRAAAFRQRGRDGSAL